MEQCKNKYKVQFKSKKKRFLLPTTADFQEFYCQVKKSFSNEIKNNHFDIVYKFNGIHTNNFQTFSNNNAYFSLHVHEEMQDHKYFHIHITNETNGASFVDSIFIEKNKDFQKELQHHLPKNNQYILYLKSSRYQNKSVCSISQILDKINKLNTCPIFISYIIERDAPIFNQIANSDHSSSIFDLKIAVQTIETQVQRACSMIQVKMQSLDEQILNINKSVTQEFKIHNQHLSSMFEEKMNDFYKIAVGAFEERIQTLNQKIVSIDGKLGQLIASQLIFKSDYVGGINKEKSQEYASLPQYDGRNFESSELGNQNLKSPDDDDNKGFQNGPENDSLIEKIGGNEVGKGSKESLEDSNSLVGMFNILEKMGGNNNEKELQSSSAINNNKNLYVSIYLLNEVIENKNISEEMEKCSNNPVKKKKDGSTDSSIVGLNNGMIKLPPIAFNNFSRGELENPDSPILGQEGFVVIEQGSNFLQEINGNPSKMENSQVIGENTHDFNVDDINLQIRLLLMNNITQCILIYNIIDDMNVVLTLISNGTKYVKSLKLDKNYKKFEWRECLPINFDISKFEIQLQYSDKKWTKIVNGYLKNKIHLQKIDFLIIKF